MASQTNTSKTLPTLPNSCTSMTINWVGVGGLIGSLIAMRAIGEIPAPWVAFIGLLGYALPIAILEIVFLGTHKRASTGLDFGRASPFVFSRILVKLVGLYATLGVIAAIYLLFPEYTGGFYTRYWQFISFMAPAFVVGSALYFAWVDRMMVDPKDGFWQAGMFVLGRFDQVNWPTLSQHSLGWLVKLFFLPLMFIYTGNFLQNFINFDFSSWFKFEFNNPSYAFFNDIMYGVDVVVVTVGYFCTLRVLDSHCRSTEPTAGGWFWALLCYEPIWSFVYGAYLNYNSDGYEWWSWLSGSPMLGAAWGTAIGILTFIYVLASIAFGLRFSNLTNRGILTNGVYRYCKHPAYVSKNLSWWLISIPFIWHDGSTWYSVIHDSALLLALNGIYFLRARTEERHLSSDPTYVTYALAMNERSIFAFMGRIIPGLRYKPGPVLVALK
jgi:hypothetical protein